MGEFLLRIKEIFDPETIQAISGPTSLYGGFLIGLVWGIVLQKSRVCKYDVVSSLFRFQDFTVFRVGSVVIMAGMVLIYLFKDLDIIQLYVPKTVMLPQILGGLLFGSGIAIMGYCPGTAAVAIGEGALDGIPAIAGMISGAVIYAEFFHDRWKDTFLTIGDIGRVTFADLLGVNHWLVIIPIVIMTLMVFISSTMFDWFLNLAGKMLNYFSEVTDGVEKTVSNSSRDVSSYFDGIRGAIDKVKSFIGNITNSGKER
jgi:uncharacterized membrane protein YedE/YeeE